MTSPLHINTLELWCILKLVWPISDCDGVHQWYLQKYDLDFKTACHVISCGWQWAGQSASLSSRKDIIEQKACNIFMALSNTLCEVLTFVTTQKLCHIVIILLNWGLCRYYTLYHEFYICCIPSLQDGRWGRWWTADGFASSFSDRSGNWDGTGARDPASNSVKFEAVHMKMHNWCSIRKIWWISSYGEKHVSTWFHFAFLLLTKACPHPTENWFDVEE